MCHRSRVFLALLSLAILVAACNDGGQTKLPTIQVSAKGITFVVEVARTEKQLQDGLMFRKSLGELEGMIFVYTQDRRMSFWMKNTTIPLSIAFLDETGKILQIEDMKPLDQVSRTTSRQSARYALEVGRGVFTKYGIVTGDRFKLPEGFPF